MLIAHLSDLHIFSGVPETRHVRLDIAEVVRQIVADIASLARLPDAVLIAGDVADGGSLEDYALVRRLLAPLSMPVFVVPGNHDRRETMRDAFADIVPFVEGPFLNFEARAGNMRVIGLDSTIPGRVEGELCATRLEWLAARLSAETAPVFLLLHHPPFSSGNGHWDATALVRGREELKRILAAAPAEVRLLSGHVHQPMHTIWAGAFAAIGGSPAFQYDFGIGMREEPPLASDPYGYMLHHHRADGSWGVHTRLLPQFRLG